MNRKLIYSPLIDDPNGNILVVEEPMEFAYSKIRAVVVKGFTSDAATIPRFVWTISGLYPTHPKIIRGAVAHDLCYLLVAAGLISREVADAIILDIIKEDGLDLVRRQLVYRTVRIRGGAYVPKNLTPQEKAWVDKCQLKLSLQ